MIDEIFSKMDNILQHQVAERHTYFQLKNFVIGKEPTIHGMMWQTIRELNTRKEALQNLQNDLDELQDQIALKDIDIQEMRSAKDMLDSEEYWKQCRQEGYKNREDEIEARRIALERMVIEIRRKLREKQKLEGSVKILDKRVKYIKEEVAYLVGAFEKLQEVQEFKPIDDVEAQREYWNNKLQEEINLRFMLGASPDVELVKTIMAIDDDAPVKQFMIKYLQGRQEHLVKARQSRLGESYDEEMKKRSILEHKEK